MTSLGTTLAALAAAAGVALSGAAAEDTGANGAEPAPAALVIDASLARDGRELLDPRLAAADAEIRLPRTAREARTNVRYFEELGYRIVAAGPRSQAAAAAADVEAARAADLAAALAGL